MNSIANTLKANVAPTAYYEVHLKGAFGKPTGNGWHSWNGLCPFHTDTRAGSLVINKVSGAFRCFSCGARGGDIIAFHMKRQGIGFTEALNQLGGNHHA
jgi:DNA primase